MKVLADTGVRVAEKNPKRTESGTRPGGRAPAPSTVRGLCRRAGFTWKMDGHEIDALSISIWKVLADGHHVCLSTPMPGEMESRAGIAPASAVLQTAA